MLLSHRKIQNILKMFTIPYRPNLMNYKSEEFDSNHFSESIIKSINYSKSINNTSPMKAKTMTKDIYKSSFPTYDFNFSQNQYINEEINYPTYPIRNEIIINNPEEVIQSGCLKGSVKQQIPPSQNGDDYNNNNLGQSQNMDYNNMNINNNNNYKGEEEEDNNGFGQKINDFREKAGEKFDEYKNSIGQKFGDFNNSIGEKYGGFKDSMQQNFNDIGNTVQQKYDDTKE